MFKFYLTISICAFIIGAINKLVRTKEEKEECESDSEECLKIISLRSPEFANFLYNVSQKRFTRWMFYLFVCFTPIINIGVLIMEAGVVVDTFIEN